MKSVGQGTVLAGRYRLEQRYAMSSTVSLWRGTDTTLDRPVAVRIVSPEVATETLDAARRAALVDDPRLVRLLDVARTPQSPDDHSVTYIVSEWVEGRSLADLLTDGPLPADHVRMLVGEAAQALSTASRAGLHHLVLGPTSLLITQEGTVKVQGLAVDAAATGQAAQTGAEADRVDTRRLVALLYAGLTGRWPLPDRVSGLDPAPMVGDLPVPPADMVSGVPNDLDTLCSVTFGPHEDGPGAPAELARQLRPWNTPGMTVEPSRRFASSMQGAPSPAKVFPAAPTPSSTGDPPAPQPITEDESDLFAGVFATGPDLGPDPASERQHRVLLAVVGLLVLVGLGLAIWAMTGLDTGPGPNTSEQSTVTETVGPATGATPVVVEASGFDPLGDGAENNDRAVLAIDGDPATAWGSSRYNSAGFGNLKSGVGLLIKLEQNSAVREVTVRSNGSGGMIEVRAATAGPELDGSQVLGSGPAGDLTVRPDPPVDTQYLIIWVTELPTTDGAFRAEITEVSVQ